MSKIPRQDWHSLKEMWGMTVYTESEGCLELTARGGKEADTRYIQTDA